jgi:DNA-binding transcriptional LysR family regulator
MELRHLRYFVTVAETLNFSQAARLLHLAQPPLSAQIKSLEHELGVRLFDRGPRGVALTKAGRILLPAARDALAAAQRAADVARVAASGRTGVLRFGLITPAATAEIAARLKRFHREYPLVQLRVRQEPVATLQRLLEAGELDLALTRPLRATPALRQKTIAEQEQLLALPADHPLARKKQVPLAALHGMPLLLISPEFNPNYGQRLLGLCAQAGVQPAVNYAADDLFTLIWLASAGLGVCPYPSSLAPLAPAGVVFRPLRPRLRGLELTLMWPAGNDSPALRALLAHLGGT